jgi:hypothetical protein
MGLPPGKSRYRHLVAQLLLVEDDAVIRGAPRRPAQPAARRIAEASGGSLVVGRSAAGGGKVTVSLGSPGGPPETRRRHGRDRLRLRA